jgi:hypothetical protein
MVKLGGGLKMCRAAPGPFITDIKHKQGQFGASRAVSGPAGPPLARKSKFRKLLIWDMNLLSYRPIFPGHCETSNVPPDYELFERTLRQIDLQTFIIFYRSKSIFSIKPIGFVYKARHVL